MWYAPERAEQCPQLLARRHSRRAFCAGLAACLPVVALGGAPGGVALVLCGAHQNRQKEFDAWWPRFARAVAAVPGVTGMESFARATVRLRDGAQPLPSHMLYLSTATMLPQVQAVVAERIGNGQIEISPAVELSAAITLSYHVLGSWGQQTGPAGARYIQLVLAEAVPGQSNMFESWFYTHHGPELAQVPGVTEETLGKRIAASPILGQPAPYPTYLSAMRFKTPSVPVFKADLEHAAKTTVLPTKTYDVAQAWRETYQQQDVPAAK